ncbi:hypothetical protein IWX91DRAFT_335114, partial [Phyllosticta citricarpa]
MHGLVSACSKRWCSCSAVRIWPRFLLMIFLALCPRVIMASWRSGVSRLSISVTLVMASKSMLGTPSTTNE